MEKKTILIIEDNKKNMKLFRDVLEINKHKVLEACSAERGIEILREQNPDLVLMDIQLSGMDGFTATQVIKKDPELKEIPIIALTALAMQGDQEKALEAGCEGYISKPIDIRFFLEEITRFLNLNKSERKAPKEKFLAYKKKILIVDDEPRNLKLLEAIIPADNFEVIKANDGEEAIEKAHKELPDLILLDVMMPKKDGFEVAKELKENPDVRNIPIIMITALDGAENRITGFESGAEEFLTKPVRPVELRARISSMLELKQYRDQLAIRNQSESLFTDVVLQERVAQEDSRELPLVLLVEDREIDATLITQVLKHEPLQLEFAKNGAEALAFIQSKRVDLILLDILLPDIDGFEICRRIKKMESGKKIPIIVITCLDDLESRITGVELGTDDFLVKPINARELKARIKVLLEKKEQLDNLCSHYDLSLNAAIVDSLTGLYNNDYFKKFLGLEIKRSLRHTYPVSLLMIDLDDFKANNDTLGHAAGDDILRAVGETIRSVVRDIDFVARYGGDEFVVVLPYSEYNGAITVAHRIQNALLSSNLLSGTLTTSKDITASIGIAVLPYDGTTSEEIIKCADDMLHKAKQKGKNQISVHSHTCEIPVVKI